MAVLSSGGLRLATAVRVAIAALTPLVGVTLAYILWWISDRLLTIGPLDRAKFGWLVVVPVWALTPFAAAYVWRRLNEWQSLIVASTTGLVVTVAAAVLFWFASAFPDCQFGAVRTPAEWILPSVVVGAVIGGGFAATCLASAAVLRGGHRWTALLVGAGSAFALIFVAILVVTLFVSPEFVCQRPPLR